MRAAEPTQGESCRDGQRSGVVVEEVVADVVVWYLLYS